VWRPARRDRLRFALTVSGIAAGVATMVAIGLANQSVLSSFSETVDAVAGKASLTVLPSGVGIPEAVLERLAWLRGTGASLAPAVTETAATGTVDGDVVEVLGIDPLNDGAVRTYRFRRDPAASARTGSRSVRSAGPDGLEGEIRTAFAIFGKDAVLVSEPFARRHGLKTGDTLPLVAAGVERRMRIAAILEAEGPARTAMSSLVVADIATVQEAFGKVGWLDRIDLVLPEGLAPEARARLTEEIRASLPPDVTVGRPERRTETVDRMVRAFRVNLTALGLIALLVGTYFVYNTLSISVLRRRTDIGTVRAVGASKRAVFSVFLVEGAILGVLGSALGSAFGVVLAKGALMAVGGTVTELYMPSAHPTLRLDPLVLAACFALGVVASIVSSIWPALEAASVDPAASMRHGSVEAARRKQVVPFALIGVTLLVLAYVAARQGPVNGLPLFGFLSVFLIVAGVSLLSPAVIVVGARLLDRPLVALLGAPARIARANLTGSLSRTSVAVSALTMGISMMVAVAVMVGSFRTTVARWVNQTLASDLFVSPASGKSGPSFGRLSDEALRAIDGVPGVVDTDPYLSFSATRDGVPFTVGSGKFAYIAARGHLPLVDGRDPKRVMAEALEKGEAMVSEPYAEKFGVTTGDTVEIPTARGPHRLRVAGVYTDYSNDRGTVTVDRALFQRLYGQTGAVSVAVTLAPGLDAEEGRRRVVRATKGRFALRVATNAHLRREVMKIFDRTFAVTYALEAVAIAVAVLGVFNTLVALVLERRREIGLLRVLGASAARVKTAVRYEAAAIGSLSSLLGLGAGGAMSLVLVHVINRQSFGWTITSDWPWGFLAAALGLVLVTTLLSAHHPARLAAETDAAAVLKEE